MFSPSPTSDSFIQQQQLEAQQVCTGHHARGWGWRDGQCQLRPGLARRQDHRVDDKTIDQCCGMRTECSGARAAGVHQSLRSPKGPKKLQSYKWEDVTRRLGSDIPGKGETIQGHGSGKSHKVAK